MSLIKDIRRGAQRTRAIQAAESRQVARQLNRVGDECVIRFRGEICNVQVMRLAQVGASDAGAPIFVTTGTPIQSASKLVVWPLYGKVSRPNIDFMMGAKIISAR